MPPEPIDVVELAAGVDDVRVVRRRLDDVVVEALPAAVVLDADSFGVSLFFGSMLQLAPASVDLKTREGW